MTNSILPPILDSMNNTDTYTLPLGFYPQLPDTVSPTEYLVSGVTGTDIDGYLLNVRRRVGNPADPETLEVLVDNMRFPTRDAAKAYTLAHGYSHVWSYAGKRLHPPVRGEMRYNPHL